MVGLDWESQEVLILQGFDQYQHCLLLMVGDGRIPLAVETLTSGVWVLAWED